MKHTTFLQKYGPSAIIAGASEGLGAAFARALAMRGMNLVLIARRAEKLHRLATELTDEYQIKVAVYPMDLSDSGAVTQFFETHTEDAGLLVYNAAYAPIGDWININTTDREQVIDVNVRAPAIMAGHMGDRLVNRGSGGIVLMSSLAGFQGTPRLAMYGASKAFNTTLAEALWYELSPHGVDVLASCAGAVRTPGYQSAQGSKEAPGTMNAADIAEQTLAGLGRGPTIVPGFVNRMVRFLMTRIFSKKQAISLMATNTKELS